MPVSTYRSSTCIPASSISPCPAPVIITCTSRMRPTWTRPERRCASPTRSAASPTFRRWTRSAWPTSRSRRLRSKISSARGPAQRSSKRRLPSIAAWSKHSARSQRARSLPSKSLATAPQHRIPLARTRDPIRLLPALMGACGRRARPRSIATSRSAMRRSSAFSMTAGAPAMSTCLRSTMTAPLSNTARPAIARAPACRTGFCRRWRTPTGSSYFTTTIRAVAR
ncbi:unknown [Sinorhizobium phage PBC5]|nr:unknown [Sinorhizobium phage PBC5]